MVISPDIGIDVGVSKARGKYLVSSSDPITGTKVNMGWHAVNVSANDVATSGIMPDIINTVALFPSKTSAATIQKVMNEINDTAHSLGITVAGGHTEITPHLTRPIITVTAIGSGDRFVTAADAKVFDSILLTKTAGIEGTSILARLPKVRKSVPRRVAQRGSSLIEKLSIMTEAKVAFETGRVHAMHDVTEGGILGAAYEMSVASNLGFEIFEDAIPLDHSTFTICSKISVNPLKLIGSGSLLIACSTKSSERIIGVLKAAGISCTAIGRFLPINKGRFLVTPRRREKVSEDLIQDELWKALRKYGNSS